MKTIYKTAMALIAATTLLTSCSDDSDGNTNNNVPSTGSYINAKVDGSDFKTLEVQGMTTAAATKTGEGDNMFITISASAQNTNTMIINMRGITGTGTYELTPNSDTFVAFADTQSEIMYHSAAECANVTGELKVTHFSNEKVEGTFTFKGADDDCTGLKNVTSGKFRGVYVN